MSELKCKCKCTNISFELLYEPLEICRCFCSICSSISKSEYMSFAKSNYKIYEQLLEPNISNKIIIKRFSNRAVRAFCNKCNDPIYMLYDNSKNIWINQNTFKFSCDHIETYDIYLN
jgi:hypothetical protein